MDTDCFIINDRTVFREEDDGAFLFDPETGSLNCLNKTGAYIWRMCEKGAYKKEIIEGLQSSFKDVPEDSLSEDISTFLKLMEEAGFITKG